MLGQSRFIGPVEFVPVPVPFLHFVAAVDASRNRAGREPTGILAETHRTTQVIDAKQIPQLVDDLVWGIRVAFRRVSPLDPADIARVLDGRPLEPVANPEVGDLPFARDLRRAHHAATPAITEPPRDQHPVGAVEEMHTGVRFQRLGFDPLDIDRETVVEAAVIQRFVQALVGVFVPDIFPDDVNRQAVGRVLDTVDE